MTDDLILRAITGAAAEAVTGRGCRSGVFTVWAHRALIAGFKKDALQAILGACLLGLYFS